MRKIASQIKENGFALVLLSVLFFSAMSFLVKLAREVFRADSLVFYRALFQCLLLSPWIASYFPREAKSKRRDRWKAHFYRGAFGVLSMWSYFLSIRYLPLSLVNWLTSTAVIWAILMGWMILGEKPAKKQLRWTAVVAVGLLFAVWNPGERPRWGFDPIGVVAALLCAFFMGSAYTNVKKLRKDYGSREIVFFFGLTSLILITPVFAFSPQFPINGREWLVLVGLGITGTIGQLLMTAGFKHTTTLVGTLGSLQQAPLNIFVGWLLLSESPPMNFFIGALVIALGIAGLLSVKTPKVPLPPAE